MSKLIYCLAFIGTTALGAIGGSIGMYFARPYIDNLKFLETHSTNIEIKPEKYKTPGLQLPVQNFSCTIEGKVEGYDYKINTFTDEEGNQKVNVFRKLSSPKI